MWCNSPMFYIPIFWSPLYPKISTQNCMHIRGSKCGCTHSTNICPYSKYLCLCIWHLIWDMLGHFMCQKRHHFCHFYTFSTIITIHVNVISAMLVLHCSLFVVPFLCVMYVFLHALFLIIIFIMYHFYVLLYTIKCLFLHANSCLLHTFMHLYAHHTITFAHKLHEGYIMSGYVWPFIFIHTQMFLQTIFDIYYNHFIHVLLTYVFHYVCMECTFVVIFVEPLYAMSF